MWKMVYVGLYDYESIGSIDAHEFLYEVLKDHNRDDKGFVIVEALTEAEAKRKVFHATKKNYADTDIISIANFLINLYDNNINDSDNFVFLEKIYDKHIGEESITEVFELSESKREGLFKDILSLDEKVFKDIVFWLFEDSIFITDKYKKISE